jgi:hypothetical protein
MPFHAYGTQERKVDKQIGQILPMNAADDLSQILLPKAIEYRNALA